MRTDRTVLCPACAIRISPAAHCPQCESTRVFDMTRPRAREAALVALRRWRRPAGWRRAASTLENLLSAYLRYWVAGIVVLAFVAGWVLEGTPSAGFTLAIFALLGQAALIGFGTALFGLASLAWSGVAWLLERTSAARDPSKRRGPRLLPGPPPESLPQTRLTRVTGHVRAAEPMQSPLGHVPCAAFRLVGEGPRGTVDDAGGRTFDVVTEDGPAKVVLGNAWIDVPVTEEPVTVRPDATLRRFLEDRGVYPELGPVRLAEGVLRDGDRVEVEGQAEEMVSSDGYRAAQRVLVFREHAGAPLTVRKLPS